MNSMPQKLNVVFLPRLLSAGDIDGADVVVTDILRASTTIISALHNGLDAVIPCAEIEEARRVKERLGPTAILGGERGGVIIRGFDQGNSPREFTPELVRGRQLVHCTTNGTVAMAHCRSANRIFIGAFVNLTAVVEQLRDSTAVTILCSGTDGNITSEDILFAGAFVELAIQHGGSKTLNDQALVALSFWDSVKADLSEGASLADHLKLGAGGRNLLKLGYDEDIRFCAQIDLLPLVPELDVEAWTIRPLQNSVGDSRTRLG
jgi:2-phosphosulfolactate phosphatase